MDSSCQLLDFVQRNGIAVGRWGMMYLFDIPKQHREDSMLGYFGSNAPYYHLLTGLMHHFWDLLSTLDLKWMRNQYHVLGFVWWTYFTMVCCQLSYSRKCQSKIQGTSFVGTVFIPPLLSQKYPQIYLLDEYLTVEFTVDTVRRNPKQPSEMHRNFLNSGLNHQPQMVCLPDF